MTDPDLIIVGSGPAGMAAASVAARSGARVLILDEQPRPGGQIYRNIGENRDRLGWLGKGYAAGTELVDDLDHPNIHCEFGATVWRSDPGPTVCWSQNGHSQVTSAPYLLLATGAQERPVPFPGWTLPGVMPAGAAQILMKTSTLLPRDAILAGSGPLLYLVAAQMIDAGTPPKALVETQTRSMAIRSARHLPRAAFALPLLLKGLGLLHKIRKHRIPRFTGATAFRAETGNGGTIQFSFDASGKAHHHECGLLLTHQGVVPSTHMTRAAGIAHEWKATQECFHPTSDLWGRTDQPGLHVAGDGAGIAGAEVAAIAGRLAARDILHQLRLISAGTRDQTSASDRGALWRALAIRPFLDTAYAPTEAFQSLTDETIVCRCEEITAGELRAAVAEGATGPRHIKTATRAGMGPCQGRMCDLTVRGILSANKTTEPPAQPRARNPIKPIPLGELAALASEPETKP
ncbi:nopaline dehydrogenase [Sedimentitalea sp. CY04]|uniref:Nopaline dehydrogenase n=1 Tax=Parasedimentitalea denitrificans TaxID=2211118 RepID=A0ABX0W7C2_9RHOB|nr:NAD(P)/FAD-dependent oxidoreductase [Sedimentitalea sp. CY04]NIZ61571.1 nopaline dehydrogenase [Sedimentitalea sp. CY04]